MRYNFLTHAAAAIIITIICGLIYATVQQAHRSAANDPQLQLAIDLKNKLNAGQSIEKLLPPDTIDIARSFGIFMVLYDNSGEAIYATGMLDGKMPQLPKGVLDFAKKNKEDVLTWQPQKGVRMAMVVEAVTNSNVGFVAVGRSLKEVEGRESNLVTMVFIAWLSCLVVVGLHWIFVILSNNKVLHN
jgi:hypothetical protein